MQIQKLLRPSLLTVALVALIFSPTLGHSKESPDDAPEIGMVWRIKGDKATVYLAGSIHVLGKKDYPLPPAYDEAYEDSDRIIFELAPKEGRDMEIAAKMQAAGVLPGGGSIEELLDEGTVKKLDAYLKESGLPPNVKKLRPWLLSILISMTETMKQGVRPEIGVDKHFEEKGNDDGKPMGGLESIDDQVSVFADMKQEIQIQLLKKTLDDLPELPDQFAKLLDSWKKGDAERLHALMNEEADEFPDLMKALLVERNENWIEPIVGYINGEENVMVVVGAGHLVGEGSVVDLLEKKGIKAERIGVAAAVK